MTDVTSSGPGASGASRAAEQVSHNASARQAAALRRVTDAVTGADTWDESVYQVRPGGDWILLDRGSWQEIKAAVDSVDGWRPWDS